MHYQQVYLGIDQVAMMYPLDVCWPLYCCL